MDDKEPTNHVAEAARTGPPASARRRQWPLAVAVLALAAALVSLTTLRGADSSAVTAAPAAQSNPLYMPLYQALSEQQAAAPGAVPLAAGSQSASSPSASATKTVEIMDYKYSPATLTVKVGDTVTWTNHDSAPHDVTITEGPEKFKSPTLKKGESFSYTFEKAGKYSYYCSIHPDMKASVTAEGSGSTPPPSEPPPSSPPHEPPPSEPGDCTSSAVADAFLGHIKGAHLETSPAQQVAEILEFDQWILTHTVWIESWLSALLESDATGKEMISKIWAHFDGAHLQVSPMDQVADILAFDQWVKSHTVWISSVLEPLIEQSTCE
jgi:amicyanin